MSLTGPLSGNGRAALLAIKIWAEDVNAKGGLLGRPVRLIYYDDQTNSSLVPGIYARLLEIDKVDLVVSGYGTNVIAAAIPVVSRHNKVFMTLFGTNPNAKAGYKRYFQIMPNGPVPAVGLTQGFFDVAMTMRPAPQTVALVGANIDYANSVLEGARTNVRRAGLKIVYDETYPLETKDFAPVIRAIQAKHPDVVFAASYPADSAGLVRAANKVALKTRIFGGAMVGLQYAAYKTQLGPLLNGMVAWEVYVPERTIKFPFIDDFLKRYQFNAIPERLDALGYFLPPYAYAMMQILGDAVENVGSLDQKKIADYMHATQFSTVVGEVRFAGNGEWAVGRPLYVQYQGIEGSGLDEWKRAGKAVVLWPPNLKSGKFFYPYDPHPK